MVGTSRKLSEPTVGVPSSRRGLRSFGSRDAVSVVEATCCPSAVHCSVRLSRHDAHRSIGEPELIQRPRIRYQSFAVVPSDMDRTLITDPMVIEGDVRSHDQVARVQRGLPPRWSSVRGCRHRVRSDRPGADRAASRHLRPSHARSRAVAAGSVVQDYWRWVAFMTQRLRQSVGQRHRVHRGPGRGVRPGIRKPRQHVAGP